MRKYILILISSLLLFSCGKPITKSEFSDKAELRRFKVETTTTKTSSGYLFFFVGQYSSSERTYSEIKFYAKNKLNEYCLFECSLHDVKIKLDSTIVNAYVEFKYSPNTANGNLFIPGTDSITYDTYRSDFAYGIRELTAIIVCNPKDFPENINLDQL